MEDMKLLKAITVWSSILLFLTSCSTGTVTLNKPSSEINGSLLEMPTPIYLGDDVKYSMPAFLWRRTQFLRFSLNKEEKQLHEYLSDREFEIFKLIVRGNTIKKIAYNLSISDKTVSTYRSRILKKMNMHSTADLVHYAIENNISD